MKRIVLFDLDGTLVVSFKSVLCATEQTLYSLNVPIPKDMYALREVGGLLKIVEEHLPINISKATFKEKYDSVLSNAPLRGVHLNSKAVHIIECLKPLGFSFIVLTNKKQSVAEIICDSLFPHDTFEAVIGRNSSHPIKPYPCIFDELNNRKVQLNQIQCMIGDSDNDRLTAELLNIDFYDIRTFSLNEIVERIKR